MLFSELKKKSLSELAKKKDVFLFEKKKDFDSLAFKRLGVYLNLLGPYVAYSQPFNLVYK
jgi:hypothetical protein